MCKWGDTVTIKDKDNKLIYVDRCIALIVNALNIGGIKTVASCCGHKNEMLGNILLDDGRVLAVMDRKVWEKFIMKNIQVDIHGNKINKKQQRGV